MTQKASIIYTQITEATVAIFHPEIIARVAIIKAKNIVQESHINILGLVSYNQNINTAGINIKTIDNTKSEFSLAGKVLSIKYNLIESIAIIIKVIIDNHEVTQGTQSLQLIELNTKIYQKTVNTNGII